MQAIESYYLEQFSIEFLEKSDRATVLFQAEQFKQYFDAQKMPKACNAYYLEKYNDILTFIDSEKPADTVENATTVRTDSQPDTANQPDIATDAAETKTE